MSRNNHVAVAQLLRELAELAGSREVGGRKVNWYRKVMVSKANLVAFYSKAAPITVRVDCESRISAMRNQKNKGRRVRALCCTFPTPFLPSLSIIAEPS